MQERLARSGDVRSEREKHRRERKSHEGHRVTGRTRARHLKCIGARGLLSTRRITG